MMYVSENLVLCYYLVNGGWSSWTQWSFCSSTCQDSPGGMQVRTRNCTKPKPRLGGETCQGEAIQKTTCSKLPCSGCTYYTCLIIIVLENYSFLGLHLAVVNSSSDTFYFTMGKQLQEMFALPANFMGFHGFSSTLVKFKTFFMTCPYQETNCHKWNYSKGQNHQWEEVAGMNRMWRQGAKYVEIGDEVWVTGGIDESNGRDVLK